MFRVHGVAYPVWGHICPTPSAESRTHGPDVLPVCIAGSVSLSASPDCLPFAVGVAWTEVLRFRATNAYPRCRQCGSLVFPFCCLLPPGVAGVLLTWRTLLLRRPDV